jgi:hypothetical protein
MKKILSLFFAVSAFGLITTSCSDYLDEDNKTGETADLVYNTVTGIDGLVYSAYSYTRGWWGKEPALGLSEMGSDLFYYGYDNKQKSLCSYDMTAESFGFDSKSGTAAVNNNPCLDQYWELFYAGIDVCNNTLKYVSECTAISDTKKTAYEGDAHFLRALYYSQMVALWGPIPYNDKPINHENYGTTPMRQPESVVYKYILDDLKLAMEKYKSAGIMSQEDATGTGRAYYYSAEALYARVALYAASWLGATSVEGYGDLYTEALNAANDVINSSGASFYNRYSDTWSMKNEENNKESLFSVHYNNVLSAGFENCVPYRFSVDANGNHNQFNSLLTRKGYNSNGGNATLLMFVPMWNNGASDLGGNGTKNTQVFVRCTGPGNANITSAKTGKEVDIAKYYSPYSRGFTRYLPSLYLWTILDEVKETDQRYNATILTSYRIPEELSQNAKNYPDMGNQQFVDYEEAYAADGNYFNGGGTAIRFSLLDGDSPEGKALQAEAKNKYRLQFASGGDIPVYTSMDPATAKPTEDPKPVSDVYGDTRYNSYKIGGWCSFPGIKKFLDDQYDPEYPTYDISYRDFMVLRLAEMYLIKAEAEMQTGANSAALATINKLRSARAIAGKDNSISGTVTIETILKERALELCGEYQRWFDLKRTHKLVDHVKAYNAQSSSNIALKHYYRPIPLYELEAVTNLSSESYNQNPDGVIQYTTVSEQMWQNPGY